MDFDVSVIIILTVGLAIASFLGYFIQRTRLPTILGYLIAGYIIGPSSPGYAADLQLTEQLAEVGVILMLFGVGLHFRLEDLNNVKKIAIPGALVQTFVSSVIGALFIYHLGWTIQSGIIIGLAIGVASTVVLVRVLSDNNLIDSPQGHISIGWLVVEDIFTVAVLILLPVFADFYKNDAGSIFTVIGAVLLMTFKFILLGVLMFTWGHRIVDYILTNVARLRSHELFTLTVLALTFVIAVGSSFVFGTSLALGAFLAGMVIGKTEARHQAFANSLPVKDVFAVIFFLSVGMLFDPQAIVDNFAACFGLLMIILLVKPLSALVIMLLYKYPFNMSLAVAVALAQIGEFSFILAEEAMNLKLLPDEGYDVLVACALVSISLNPLLFRAVRSFGFWLSKSRKNPLARAKRIIQAPQKIKNVFQAQMKEPIKVVVVGYGLVGKAACTVLEEQAIRPVVIEHDIDTVNKHKLENRELIFGDATMIHILESAGVATADLLLICILETAHAFDIVRLARSINPDIKIVTRVNRTSDVQKAKSLGVEYICSEKEVEQAYSSTVSTIVKFMC